MGSLTIATTEVAGKKTVTRNIVFDGAAKVFDGTDTGSGVWGDVVCTLNATLLYDGQGAAGTEGDHAATLLGQTCTVVVAPLPIKVTGEITGVRTQEDFTAYVQGIQSFSVYDTRVQAYFGDPLMTLITCSYHAKEGRFVVVTKRTQDK